MCLGVPGEVVEIGAEGMGRVRFGGIVKDVCLSFVPEARVGDYVIVHVGFALARLDEAEARKTLDLLREMDEAAGKAPASGAP